MAAQQASTADHALHAPGQGVILRGADLSELARELLILAGFIASAMTVAVMRFTKRLD